MTSKILNPDGSPVTPTQIALSKLEAAQRAGHTAMLPNPTYRGASNQSQELAMFRSPHTSALASARWDRQILTDRARDLVRNESLVASAIRKKTGMAIGSGWTLQATPDGDTLGLTPEETENLSDQIERAFRTWADDPRRQCDARRRTDFGGLLRELHTEWSTVDEALAVLIYRKDPRSPFGTGVQVIDTDRLCNPNGQPDSDSLRDGVEIDAYGAAQGYYIRRAHAADWVNARVAHIWDYVEREDVNGRPVAIHGYRTTRAEQGRGITALAPLIEKVAMLSNLARNQAMAAVLQASFAAFVQSGFDGEAVASMLGMDKMHGDSVAGFQDLRMSFYGDNPVSLNGVKIPILMPGDRVEGNTLSTQAAQFDTFKKELMRMIAAQTGVAESAISGDYTGLNFSTMRGQYNEIWNDILIDRADFGTQLVRPIYLAVIDEALALGRITPPPSCPDLWDEPAAWLRSNWIGPARGYIDPEKEAKGDVLALEMGVTSVVDVAAARGRDYEDVARTNARARRINVKYGLPNDPVRESALMPTPAGNQN